MDDWAEHYRDAYLKQIIGNYSVPKRRICTQCRKEGLWRCPDCFGRPLLCDECCVTLHRRHPWHRVEAFHSKKVVVDGRSSSLQCFDRSSLREAGLELWLGHGGSLCPWYQSDEATKIRRKKNKVSQTQLIITYLTFQFCRTWRRHFL